MEQIDKELHLAVRANMAYGGGNFASMVEATKLRHEVIRMLLVKQIAQNLVFWISGAEGLE